MPSSTPSVSSENVENLEMPMRVEMAMPSIFMTRRSMVRAIRLVTIRKPAMTTTPLSSDQRLNCALPGIRSMLSSVRSTPLNQPSTWKEIDRPDREREADFPGADPAVGPQGDGQHVHRGAHQHQHGGQVHARRR